MQIPLARIKDGRGKFCSRKCLNTARGLFPEYLFIIKKIADIRRGKKESEVIRKRKSIARLEYCKTIVGKIISSKQYNLIYAPDHFSHEYCNYVAQHRYLVETILKRPLTKNECVHHINENKKDNRIINLMVFNSNSAHRRFHNNKKVYKKEIVFDGRIYEGTKRKGPRPKAVYQSPDMDARTESNC